MIEPTVNDTCNACGICEQVCPFHAIKIGDKAVVNNDACGGCTNCVYNCPNNSMTSKLTFDLLLSEAAGAVLKAFGQGKKPVFYVNDARSITKYCDCFSNPGAIIAKDVGLLLGDDIVAIDKASIDLVREQEGAEVFQGAHHHNPYLQIIESENNRMGKQEYDLVKSD
jgi:uncharacterized protein